MFCCVFVHVVVVVTLSEAEQQVQNDKQDQKDLDQKELDQKELDQDKLIFQLEGDNWRVRNTAHHSPGKHNTRSSQFVLGFFVLCRTSPESCSG